MAKKNDWVATMLYNQPSSFDEVVANGITPENSDIKSKDYYKNLEPIQETFTREDGKFDEVAYDNFYNSSLAMYNQFSERDWTNKLIDEMAKDSFDWTQPLKTDVKDISVTIETGRNNPERRSLGIAGIGSIGNPTLSIREVAQDNYVRDINGKKLDWTPNQKGGFFKSVFRPTLALATWDEDGVHKDENGQDVMHLKGDYKTDEKGDFYYEELGDREGYDKEILRWSDTLTVDGTSLNKYDFLDSDSLDKSITSVLAKTVCEIAPLLIPGIGKVYGTVGALANLAAAMPTLGKAVNGIIGNNENSLGKTLTQMENWVSRFSETSTDYAQEHIASIENLGNIIVSSAKQLYQQRSLAEMTRKLNQSMSNAHKISTIGQKVSLGYLALTSSQEMYGDFKRAGASDAAAGIGMLASIAGLYELMDQDYFRDQLFKGTFMDESESLGVIKHMSKDIQDDIQNKITDGVFKLTVPGQKEAIGLFNKIKQKTKEKWTKFVNTKFSGKIQSLADEPEWKNLGNILNRAVNEGVEETMEEITADSIKGIFAGLNAMGINVKDDDAQQLDFQLNLKDMMLRYLSSFVGGAIGGATFEGINIWEKAIGPKITELRDLKDSNKQALYLIMTGHAQEMRDRAKKLRDKGMLGDKNLSGFDFKEKEGDKKTYIYTRGTETDNQNELVYNAIINQINYLEDQVRIEGLFQMSLVQNPLMVMDSEYAKEYLKNKKTISDAAKEEGISEEEYFMRYKENAFTKTIEHFKLHSSYMNDVVNIGKEIIATKGKINDLTNFGEKNESELADIQSYQYLKKHLDDLRTEYKDLIQKKNSDIYAHQALSMIHSERLSAILGENTKITERDAMYKGIYDDIRLYTRFVTGKLYKDLSKAQQEEIKNKFEKAKSEDDRVDKLIIASKILYKLNELYSDKFKDLNEKLKDKSLDIYHDHGTLISGTTPYQAYEKLLLKKVDLIQRLEDSTVQLQNEELAFKAEREAEYKDEDDIEAKVEAEVEAWKHSSEYLDKIIELEELNNKIAEVNNYLKRYQEIYGNNSHMLVDEAITHEGKKNVYSKYADLHTKLEEINSDWKKALELSKELEKYKNEVYELILWGGDLALLEKSLTKEKIEKFNNLISEYSLLTGEATNFSKFNLDLSSSFIDPESSSSDPIAKKYWLNADSGSSIPFNDDKLELDTILVNLRNVIKNKSKEAKKNQDDLIQLTIDYYQELKDKNMISDNNNLFNRVIDNIITNVQGKDLSTILDSRIRETIMDKTVETEEGNWWNENKDEVTKLFNELGLFISNHNYSNAMNSYNAIIEKLSEFAKINPGVKSTKELINNILSDYFNNNIIDFINKINELKQDITSYDIIDLIRDFDINLDVDDKENVIKIVDLINSERFNLLKFSDSSEYIIKNEFYNQALSKIPNIAFIISTMFDDTYSGFNTALNEFRNSSGKSKLFDKTTETTKNIIISDLSYISSQALILKELSDANRTQKKNFHKLSEIKTKTDFAKNILVDRFDPDSLINKISKGFGASDDDDLNNIITKLLAECDLDEKLNNINDANFKKLNEFIIKFGDALYDLVEKYQASYKEALANGRSMKSVGEVFAELLPSDAYCLITGEANDADNSDLDQRLTQLSTIIYLTSLGINKSTDFWSKMKYLRSKHQEIVPLVSQEWNIQIAISFIKDEHNVFNDLVTGIKNTLTDDEIVRLKLDDDSTKYLKDKIEYKSLMFIQGGCGAGKTDVVSRLINEYLHLEYGDDVEVIAAGPSNTQKDKLKNVLGVEEDHAYTFKELLNKICPDIEFTKTESSDSSHRVYKDKKLYESDLTTEGIFEPRASADDDESTLINNKKRVVILDEATFLPSRDLDLLTTWAYANGIKIIALGDKKQNSFSENIGSSVVYSGLEDGYMISGLTLTESIRSSYIAQALNIDNIGRILKNVVSFMQKNPEKGIKAIDKYTKQLLSNPTKIIYYESANTFVGNRFIAKSYVDEYIDKFLKFSTEQRKNNEKPEDKVPRVLLITDDVAKYSKNPKDGLTILNPTDAQGGEYDYVIIDYNFNRNSSLTFKLKDYYTSIGRAQIGSVVVDNTSLLNELNLDIKLADESVKDSPVSFIDDASSHKEWKNELLKNISEFTPESKKETSEPETTTSSSTSSGTTSSSTTSTTSTTGTTGGTSSTTSTTTPPSGTGTTGTSSPAGGPSGTGSTGGTAASMTRKLPIKSHSHDDEDGSKFNQEIDDAFSMIDDDDFENIDSIAIGRNNKINSANQIGERLNFIKSYWTLDADKKQIINIDKIKNETDEIKELGYKPIWNSNDPKLSDEYCVRYYEFVRLLSSAVLFNIELSDKHKTKILETAFPDITSNETAKSILDSFVEQWNKDDRTFIVKQNEGKDTSTVYYMFEFEGEKRLLPVLTINCIKNIRFTKASQESPFTKVAEPLVKRLKNYKRVDTKTAFKFGSEYKSSKIFAPIDEAFSEIRSDMEYTEICDILKRNGYSDDDIQFYIKNKGKTFTIWSDCDILVDSDFEELFKYGINPESEIDPDTSAVITINKKSFIDTKNREVENQEKDHDGEEVKTYSYQYRNSLANLRLFGVQRTATLNEAYNICNIMLYYAGMLTFPRLTQRQKDILKNEDNKDNALSFLSNFFEEDVLKTKIIQLSGASDETDSNPYRNNANLLNYELKLLSSNAESYLIPETLLVLMGLNKDEYKGATIQFNKEIFNQLSKFKRDKTGRITSQRTFTFVFPGDFKNTYILKIDDVEKGGISVNEVNLYKKSNTSYSIEKINTKPIINNIAIDSTIPFENIIQNITNIVINSDNDLKDYFKKNKLLSGTVNADGSTNVDIINLLKHKAFKINLTTMTHKYDDVTHKETLGFYKKPDYDHIRFIFSTISKSIDISVDKLDELLRAQQLHFKFGFILNDMVNKSYYTNNDHLTSDTKKTAWKHMDSSNITKVGRRLIDSVAIEGSWFSLQDDEQLNCDDKIENTEADGSNMKTKCNLKSDEVIQSNDGTYWFNSPKTLDDLKTIFSLNSAINSQRIWDGIDKIDDEISGFTYDAENKILSFFNKYGDIKLTLSNINITDKIKAKNKSKIMNDHIPNIIWQIHQKLVSLASVIEISEREKILDSLNKFLKKYNPSYSIHSTSVISQDQLDYIINDYLNQLNDVLLDNKIQIQWNGELEFDFIEPDPTEFAERNWLNFKKNELKNIIDKENKTESKNYISMEIDPDDPHAYYYTGLSEDFKCQYKQLDLNNIPENKNTLFSIPIKILIGKDLFNQTANGLLIFSNPNGSLIDDKGNKIYQLLTINDIRLEFYNWLTNLFNKGYISKNFYESFWAECRQEISKIEYDNTIDIKNKMINIYYYLQNKLVTNSELYNEFVTMYTKDKPKKIFKILKKDLEKYKLLVNLVCGVNNNIVC